MIVLSTSLPGWDADHLSGTPVVLPPEGGWKEESRKDILSTATAYVSLLSERIDRQFFEQAPQLRVVANYAVGYNNIDVDEATRRGIWVANTPDVLTEATADLTFALMLAVARKVGEGERLLRTGRWTGWAPDLLLGASLYGQSLGLIGYGRIGRAVAKRAQGFSMTVMHTTSTESSDDGWVPMNELLRRADFVSLHCPLNEKTRGLLGKKELAVMKQSAFVINTARGECIDESALSLALQNGEIAGAALDVFDGEPRIAPELLKAPNTVLLPHLGSATGAAREGMTRMCMSAIKGVLQGERPNNLVNGDLLL